MKGCKGKGCGEAFDATAHSDECLAEHELITSEQYQLGYVSGIAAAIAVCDDYGTREAQMISKTLGDMTPNVQIEGQAASGQSRSNAGLRVNTTE